MATGFLKEVKHFFTTREIYTGALQNLKISTNILDIETQRLSVSRNVIAILHNGSNIFATPLEQFLIRFENLPAKVLKTKNRHQSECKITTSTVIQQLPELNPVRYGILSSNLLQRRELSPVPQKSTNHHQIWHR